MATGPGRGRRGSHSDVEELSEPQPGLSLDVPEELIKDPNSWTTSDIVIWLHWLGIGEHAGAFVARGVDGRILLQLGAESAWEELGVVDPAQQRVLDSAVEPLQCFREPERLESGLALHAIEGPLVGEVFFIGPSGITGGRHSASNGVVLSENYVSRRHFQITRDLSGQHFLQDVGSTTGTFLMVRDEVTLEHGMVLQLGTSEITVSIEDSVCTLVVTDGPDKDVQAVVPMSGLCIGREAGNGLSIRDPQISSFHCEVRPSSECGRFYLDDKYSTNRTWLRLGPDGQPSRRFQLCAGDLFKVGSTLFHVVDPSTIPEPPEQPQRHHPHRDFTPIASAAPPPAIDHLARAAFGARSPDLDAEPDAEPSLRPPAIFEGRGELPAPQMPVLRWETVPEGDIPGLSPREYAARLTESRRNAQPPLPGASASRSWNARSAGPSELHISQDAGLLDVHQRELSSMQQGMRNSRAQAAYDVNQQKSDEDQTDEDTCKICYDRKIQVVLYPCRHFMLCRWCAFKVSLCPVCRSVITDIIQPIKS